MKITLEADHLGHFRITSEFGDEVYTEIDWEFPGIASAFGWQACPCGKTDGTVDCPHRKAGDMISEAQDYLYDHVGDSIDDPGYFSESWDVGGANR